MGRVRRTIPKRMPEKLKLIRTEAGCTLEEMSARLEAKLVELGYPNIKLYSGNIHEYESLSREKGREPQLPVLLAYALIAGVSLDRLVDDRLDLKTVADTKINRKKKQNQEMRGID